MGNSNNQKLNGSLKFPEQLNASSVDLSQAMDYVKRVYPSLTRLMFNGGVWIDDDEKCSSVGKINNSNNINERISARSPSRSDHFLKRTINHDSKFDIPIEIILQIIDFLDQRELLAFSTTCKLIRSYMQNDMYLWPQTVRVRTFKHLVKYCEKSSRYLFHISFYSDIGQALHYYDNLIFPFLSINKTKKLEYRDVSKYSKQEEWGLDYKIMSEPFCCFNWRQSEDPKHGSGSMLFYQEYVMDHYDCVYEIDILNGLLLLLFKMRKYVRTNIGSRSIPEFVFPNLRCAIRDLRIFFHSDHKLLKLLKSREKEDPQNAPLEKLEQDESDLPIRIDNTFKGLKDDELGQPPLYFCLFCNTTMGGMTCNNCSKLLVLDSVTEGSSSCPSCKKGITRPICCQQSMQTQKMPWLISESHASPLMQCKQCSFGVNGTRCFTCTTAAKNTSASGTPLEYNGFFKRVWDSDVWTCPNSCGRAKRGGKLF